MVDVIEEEEEKNEGGFWFKFSRKSAWYVIYLFIKNFKCNIKIYIKKKSKWTEVKRKSKGEIYFKKKKKKTLSQV